MLIICILFFLILLVFGSIIFLKYIEHKDTGILTTRFLNRQIQPNAFSFDSFFYINHLLKKYDDFYLIDKPHFYHKGKHVYVSIKFFKNYDKANEFLEKLLTDNKIDKVFLFSMLQTTQNSVLIIFAVVPFKKGIFQKLLEKY